MFLFKKICTCVFIILSTYLFVNCTQVKSNQTQQNFSQAQKMEKSLHIVLLGAPGSGKGTQGELLSSKYNIPHLSSGDILRTVVVSGSKQGKEIKRYMDSGGLIPVEMINKIMIERLNKEDCKKGFILDGYPRRVEEAYALNSFLKEKAHNGNTLIVNLDIKESDVIQRIQQRALCAECNANKKNGKDLVKSCKNCRGDEIVRSDDNPLVAKMRLKTYLTQTQPLIDYFKTQNGFVSVNGEQSINDVFHDIQKEISQFEN